MVLNFRRWLKIRKWQKFSTAEIKVIVSTSHDIFYTGFIQKILKSIWTYFHLLWSKPSLLYRATFALEGLVGKINLMRQPLLWWKNFYSNLRIRNNYSTIRLFIQPPVLTKDANQQSIVSTNQEAFVGILMCQMPFLSQHRLMPGCTAKSSLPSDTRLLVEWWVLQW